MQKVLPTNVDRRENRDHAFFFTSSHFWTEIISSFLLKAILRYQGLFYQIGMILIPSKRIPLYSKVTAQVNEVLYRLSHVLCTNKKKESENKNLCRT